MATKNPYWKLKSSWSWWRKDGHNYSVWESFLRTIRFDIFGPIDEAYSWLWLKTIGRIYFRRIKRIEKYLRGHR